MENKLTTGEWRLFLLSECLNNYPDIHLVTKMIREGGKDAILAITKKDAEKLDDFMMDSWIPKIREELRGEWKFTNRVNDHGTTEYTCDYCQHQLIRYKYLCVNEKNRTWLNLGSVCVGNIIYGEEKMHDKAFSEAFVKSLDKLKVYAKPQQSYNKPKETDLERLQRLRREQHARIKDHSKFLGEHFPNNEFYISLKKHWESGKIFSKRQEEKLIEWSTREQQKLKK